MVQEYGGITLSKLTKEFRLKRQFSENELRNILIQILRATQYMHSRGVCHRDLKPDNILLKTAESLSNKDSNFNVKIIDFNVALLPQNGSKMTGSAGLKEWSAPEMSNGSEYDFKVDLWTIGCLMYYLVKGEPPYWGILEKNKIKLQTLNFFTVLSDYQESLSFSEMINFLHQLLVVDPTNRMSATEALNHAWLKTDS